jgi:hypothetical protein
MRAPVSYGSRGAVLLDHGTAVRYHTAVSHTGGQRYAVRILSSGLAVVPRGAVPHGAVLHRAVHTAEVEVPRTAGNAQHCCSAQNFDNGNEEKKCPRRVSFLYRTYQRQAASRTTQKIIQVIVQIYTVLVTQNRKSTTA